MEASIQTSVSDPFLQHDRTLTMTGQLTNLTSLQLGLNRLTGPIPSCIGNLTSLTYLNLGQNSINGTVPDGICESISSWSVSLFSDVQEGSLENLNFLNLGTNQLGGQIPSCIGNLRQLVFLFLVSISAVWDFKPGTGHQFWMEWIYTYFYW